MSDIDKDGEIVLYGDGDALGMPVSMQLYQAIYNDITGKTEVISDAYSECLILTLEDVVKLQHIFEQFCEQYSTKAGSSSVTIYHVKSTKERFSSFDRLRTYNVNNNSPIERILIELNLLIMPPKLKEFQNYKIKINFISGAALVEKTRKVLPIEVPINIIMRAIQEKSLNVEIEYVDYIIARSLSDLIREWVGTLEKVSSSGLIRGLQDVSHVLRNLIVLMFFSIPMVFFYFFCIKKAAGRECSRISGYSIFVSVGIWNSLNERAWKFSWS